MGGPSARVVRVACAVATLCAVGTAGAPAPAAAERGSVVAERGNAPPAVDIVRLAVDNAERWFTLRADVADLGERGRFTFYYWRGRHATPPSRSLVLEVVRAEGETRARLFTCGFEDCARDRCRGLRARWDRAADAVTVTAPQRCYPHRVAGLPAEGRFSVEGQVGGAYDAGPAEPLLLARG